MGEIPGKGERIRLVSSTDGYTKLRAGDEGTVTRVREEFDDVTVCVAWDSGSSLSLVASEDEWEVLSDG